MIMGEVLVGLCCRDPVSQMAWRRWMVLLAVLLEYGGKLESGPRETKPHVLNAACREMQGTPCQDSQGAH